MRIFEVFRLYITGIKVKLITVKFRLYYSLAILSHLVTHSLILFANSSGMKSSDPIISLPLNCNGVGTCVFVIPIPDLFRATCNVFGLLVLRAEINVEFRQLGLY